MDKRAQSGVEKEKAMDFLKRRPIRRMLINVKRHRRLYASIIDKVILGLIIINAITIGMETSHDLMDKYGRILVLIDEIILAIFILEIGLKMLVMKSRFFKNSWNVYDLIIIGLSCLHFNGNIAILRCLRILRIFLLISFLPNLRFIVQSLVYALQGIISIGILLVLIYYVFGVVATHLFSGMDPDNFGTLGKSLFSLFQVMTLDSWSTIVRGIVDIKPYASLFFVTFILISTYVILNIFIAIIVNGMRQARLKNESTLRNKYITNEIAEEDVKLQARLNEVIEKLSSIEDMIASLQAQSDTRGLSRNNARDN